MDVDGLERAERLLDLGKRLVGADGCGIAENPFGQVGAHHVEAVKRRLGRDGIGLAAERKGRLADVEFEVLGHLVAVDDGAALRPIWSLPRSGFLARATAAAMTARSRSVAANRRDACGAPSSGRPRCRRPSPRDCPLVCLWAQKARPTSPLQHPSHNPRMRSETL
jgi:hypothetical protein